MAGSGSQHELILRDVRVRVPWNGVSPRVLTKAAKALFLRHGRQKSVSEFVDPDQLEFDLDCQEGPSVVYRGAPSLLSLAKES